MNVSRWQFAKRLIPLIALMALVLTGCNFELDGALDPKGPVAKDQLWLILFSLGIMLLVLVVVFVLFFYVIVKFRRRKGQENVIPKQVEGNHKLEIIWTVIPLILLLVIAIPTVTQTFKLAEDKSKEKGTLNVTVVAHQFWWEFKYPDLGITSAQDLYMPVDTTVQFELESADVLHSFWIPQLGGKIDTTTGLTNKMYLEADEIGIYKGKCAELCGASHALMDFKAVVVEKEEFNAWADRMKTPAVVTDDVAAGQEIFTAKCMACHAVTADGAGSGPNLRNYADREVLAGFIEKNDENLKKWIKNPQDMKPGATMPAFGKDYNPNGLTDQEINDLVKYLNTLKVE